MVVVAYEVYAWPGVAAAVGALVMWALLHVNRMLQVFKRAASRPVGHVDSAVMLNAKLHSGQSLLHVLALTRALGQRESEPAAQPEIFRWTDAAGSHVRVEFLDGKLVKWTLERPAAADAVGT